MFYSQFILAKKGPLATIWIAAHLERKLRKNQITETDIGDSVDSILYPEVPIALRLSGHLLLGVVRIYSRKVNLLFHDCSEALAKIRQAFEISAVNLPPGSVVAPYHSITLPEDFDFDDLEAHFGRENAAAQARTRNEFEHHVTARDLITLQDQIDDQHDLFSLDERFADAGNPYAVLDLAIEEFTSHKPDAASAAPVTPRPEEIPTQVTEDDVLPPLPMEEDMDFGRMDFEQNETTPKFQVSEKLDNDVTPLPMEQGPQAEAPEDRLPSTLDLGMEVPEVEKLRAATEVNNEEHLMGLEDLDMQKDASVTMDIDDGFRSVTKEKTGTTHPILDETPVLREESTPFRPQIPSPIIQTPNVAFEDTDILGNILGGRTPNLDVVPTPASARRDGRKRKRIFDSVLILSSIDMKKQLKSTSDICRTRRKAPSTEYEIWMSQRENHIEQNYSSPSVPGMAGDLKSLYDRILSRKIKPPGRDSRSSRGLLKPQVEVTGGRVDDKRTEETGTDKRAVDADFGLEELEHDATVQDVETRVPSTHAADKSTDVTVETAADVVEGAQPEVPLSLDPHHTVDHAAAIDATVGDLISEGRAEVTDAETSFHESTAVEGKGMGGVSLPDVDVTPARQHMDFQGEDAAELLEVEQSEGLGFLADSRETGEPAYEVGTHDGQAGNTAEDNSGWSSRTRAVAQYLKERFEALDTSKNTQRKLNLESMLTGRKRKEAARMFFETLVLGTKGYLQVEQDGYYRDIHLSATQRLMKAVF